MFHDAIVGVDGSPTGRDAIALARLLVDADGRLTLANIRAHEVPPPAAAAEVAGRGDSERLLEAERAATEVDADLVSLAARSVGRGLHALAEERASDLLVVGSCRRGIVGRVLVGQRHPRRTQREPVRDRGRAARVCAQHGRAAHDRRRLRRLARERCRARGRPRARRALRRQPARAAGGADSGLAVGGFGGAAWGDTLENLVADAQRGLSVLAGRRRRGPARDRRGGAGGVRRTRRPPRRRLARLRAAAPPDAGQRLRPSRRPCPLPPARVAARRDRARRRSSTKTRPRADRSEGELRLRPWMQIAVVPWVV